ncbi:putative membrane protein [Wickerhamomyces ciferrii]|uniref:Membrane protein n=1 Tax=Wickerhamomyces ciferrii (strain ATCC 14091 / BCRC 22168 / CBS 111 / JCM 3599 / NBRC 0793 / NRRL Y-1031 F-60-10) TaxID=1206466 RepID=K0KK46_WICCF|nr:uncharacterized protein BN7_2829 [Wickerhamomyces ciferrii]CCH43281.1 putative membrane protein [Wickerhamomyces ciferrii]
MFGVNSIVLSVLIFIITIYYICTSDWFNWISSQYYLTRAQGTLLFTGIAAQQSLRAWVLWDKCNNYNDRSELYGYITEVSTMIFQWSIVWVLLNWFAGMPKIVEFDGGYLSLAGTPILTLNKS